MRLQGVPVFTQWNRHEGLELLYVLVRVRQVLDPEFLCKLLVSVFDGVDYDAFHLGILPLLLEFIDLGFLDLL